jgi:hypothetical protein
VCGADDTQKPRDLVKQSEDVAWLEGIAASLDQARELDPGSSLSSGPRKLRTEAYARLGKLGTPEALAAVRRIEESAKMKIPAPEFAEPFSTHPAWHFGDPERRFLAEADAENGLTYAVLTAAYLGADDDYFFTWRETKDSDARWHRPVFTLLWQRPKSRSLAFTESDYGPGLLFSMAQHIPINRALEDNDLDGWTNWEEQIMNLREDSPDTDEDGVPDGKDVCPDYAPKPEDETDDDVRIIQKAFFATFGLTDSRYLLLVGEKSRKVQLWGYAGPVLYRNSDEWRSSRGLGGVFVNWEIIEKSDDKATVRISDWEGNLAASSQKVFLRKVQDDWFVVGREFGRLS